MANVPQGMWAFLLPIFLTLSGLGVMIYIREKSGNGKNQASVGAHTLSLHFGIF